MDRASQALAQGIPPGIRNIYRARAEYHNVARSTLNALAFGRCSKEEKAQSQQYLNLCEEKAVVKFVLQMAELGQSVRIKHISLLAFSVARQRSTNKPPKLLGKNWAQAFKKHYPEFKARTNKVLDWDRYYIYNKVVHWFEMIGKVFQHPIIVPENVYNMDKTGVILNMSSSVKVLVSKNNMRGYKNARIKRTVVIFIEYINRDGKYLNSLIIWSASIY